jgi:peptidoglycan/LPS O-acetylase OafA/YrhL
VKINSVQYLRGLAAIIVLIAHSILHPLKIHNTDVQRFASLGVLMSFVISGFIKHSLIQVVPPCWIRGAAVSSKA